MGSELGIPNEKILALEEYATSPLYDDQERVALEYADAITLSDRDVDEGLFERVRGGFDEDAVVELTTVIAWENSSSKFNRAMGVPSQGLWKRGWIKTRRRNGVGDEARTGTGMRKATVAEATERLPGPGGERSAKVLGHGSMEVKIYAPRGTDPQTPHTRDELYVVVSGSGEFANGPERHSFGPGDVLFVPAGVEHRFEDFADNLVVWVVFYGPEGGEVDS